MKKRWGVAVVATSLLFSLIGGRVEAGNYYDDRTKEIEERIDGIEEDVLKLKKTNLTLDRDRAEIERELTRVIRVMDVTKERYAKKKQESDRVKSELIRLYEDIRNTEYEMAKREGEFRNRVQSMHTGQSTSIIDVVVSANSFTDLVSRVFTYKKIVEKDNEVIEDYLALVDRLNKQKKSSEDLKNKIDIDMIELEKISEHLKLEKDKVEDLKRELELESLSVSERIERLMEDRDNLLKAKKAIVDEKKRFESVLATVRVDVSNFASDASVEREIESGRMFVTPAKGRLTSPYGNRQNPTGPGIEFHTGIDIANAKGTPIHASAGGVVSRIESSNSGYGNVIYVDHVIEGKKYISVYAHLDAFAVAKGEKVEQGQVIALMGTTGRSTGNHLHFEVRETTSLSDVKGHHVNPMIYVGKDTDKIIKTLVVDEKKKEKAKGFKDALEEVKSLDELNALRELLDKENKK